MSSTASFSPSGSQLELIAGDYHAIVVELGGALRSLEHRGRPVIDGYQQDEICEGARGQLLIPWPNRIEDGRYRFASQERQLPISEPERHCAIHGLLRWVPWRIREHQRDRAVLTARLHPQPGYPHMLDLTVDYRLDAHDGITIALTAVNIGHDPAPYGFGMHPYLTVATPTIDSCELQLPAASWLPTDERGIPHGRPQPIAGSPLDFRSLRLIGQTAIDFAFCDLNRDAGGRATVSLRDPLSGRSSSLWIDASIRWLEVFTGDHLPSRQRQGLGIEPMSCPPNAFASGEDVIVLQAQGSHRATFGIHAS